MKQQSWGCAQKSPTQRSLRNMSWTKYPIGCLRDLVFTGAQYSSICNMLYVLFSLTNGCRLLPVEALHSVQPLACYILVYYSATFVTLAVAYVLLFILVISRAPTRLLEVHYWGLRAPKSAGRRTIQARICIVRVPAIVRVKSLGTYPHYRGTPTVLQAIVPEEASKGSQIRQELIFASCCV